MEDAHIAEPNLANDLALFAIFDGHGGSNYNHRDPHITF